MEIKIAGNDDLNAIVRLHKKTFRGILSGELPAKYLFDFYKCVQTNNNCAIYVAKQGDNIAGFIAGSANGKYAALRLKLGLLKIILSKEIADARGFVQILRILKKGYYYYYLNIRAELIAIAVMSEYRRQGLGGKLVKELEKYFIRRKIRKYHVFTDNEISNGLSFYRFFKFHEIFSVDLFGFRGTFLKKLL